MLKCKECKQYKKDVKLRFDHYDFAIKYDYQKKYKNKCKKNLCEFCYDYLQESI